MFKDLLLDLNGYEPWRAIYGRRSNRMKDQELILRFFALFFAHDRYFRPMKKFLNEFMGKHRHLRELKEDYLRRLFRDSISTIGASLGVTAFRPQGGLNAAVFDSVMVGLARRIDSGGHPSERAVSETYFELLQTPAFVDAVSQATADKDSVEERIRLATAAFAKANGKPRD